MKFTTAVCLTASLLFAADGFAAEPASHSIALAPFVNSDTFAVAHFDIVSMKPMENSGQLFFLLPKLPADAQTWAFGVFVVDGFVRRFQEAGGQDIYIVAGLGDVHLDGGPVVLATAKPGRHPEEVGQLFRDMLKEMADNPSQKTLRPIAKLLDVQQKGDVVLLGMKSTVSRYAGLHSAPRSDLIGPLARLTGEGATAAAVFCPGADFRRVVRELWPELPGSLAPLRGELADRWLHVEAAVNGPPDPKPRVVFEARDAESAELFAKLWKNLPTETTEFGGNNKAKEQVKGYAQLLVKTLPAKVEGKRVVIGMPTDEDRLANLRAMFSAAADASMESANHRERMDRFKQIALAMHNYYDVHKCLPPAAVRDKDGKPLLSWRVAILPYIEQNDLYKQFHLDEPWDSPHNRSLIEKMPGTYMDLGPKADQLNHDGKTTFQVPVGPQTVFYKNEGTKFSEITDGTSATILLVEVEPRRAVIWSKPEDWEADLEHPRRGVERNDRNQFVAAWCDGSVQYVSTDVDEKKLRSRLTRAGRETVDWP
jgi:hypothetical protein